MAKMPPDLIAEYFDADEKEELAREERRQPPPILDVQPNWVHEYKKWFVNRLAYTEQSKRPGNSGKHYYYRPRVKNAKGEFVGPKPLTVDVIHQHLAGHVTIGLYAIEPRNNTCKWLGLDADYPGGMEHLEKFQSELELEGVASAIEYSRRQGHLWIFAEEPLSAHTSRIYLLTMAMSLGIPVKGLLGAKEGLEIFPRQSALQPEEFGNALRGPLGVHRTANERFYFKDAAGTTLEHQFDYLRNLPRLSVNRLAQLTSGMEMPDEFVEVEERIITADPDAKWAKVAGFDISQYVNFDRRRVVGTGSRKNYETQCPSCAERGGDTSRDNLHLKFENPAVYICRADCHWRDVKNAALRAAGLSTTYWRKNG